MNATLSIGLSGMRAAEARVNASASNIAHSLSSGKIPDAVPAVGDVYRPVDVVQSDAGSSGQPRGVTYSYVTRPNAFTIIYDPGSPNADINGTVALPNVEIATELVSVFVAKYQFLTSAKVVKAEQQITKTAIDTLA